LVSLKYGNQDAVSATFTKDDALKKVSWPMLNPNQTAVKYELYIGFTNGRDRHLTGWTTRRNLLLKPDANPRHVVQLSPKADAFEIKGLQAIEVDLRSERGFDGQFVFDSADDVAFYEFEYRPAQKQFWLQKTYHYENGRKATVPEEKITFDGQKVDRIELNGRSAKSLLERTVEIKPSEINWQQINEVTLKLRAVAGEKTEFRFDKNINKTAQWTYLRPRQDDDAYAWQLVVKLGHGKLLPGKTVVLPSQSASGWEPASGNSFQISEQITAAKLFRAKGRCLLTAFDSTGVDWQKVNSIQLTFKASGQAAQTVTIQKDEQFYFDAKLGAAVSVQWQARFDIEGRLEYAYYPGPASSEWQNGRLGETILFKNIVKNDL
ncbi:MAG: hypothetical protein AAF490_20890, partial [Chloroflexota bacterium]